MLLLRISKNEWMKSLYISTDDDLSICEHIEEWLFCQLNWILKTNSPLKRKLFSGVDRTLNVCMSLVIVDT